MPIEIVTRSEFENLYTDVELCSKGSYGRIYKCKDTKTNKYVALKEFRTIISEMSPRHKYYCMQEYYIMLHLKRLIPEHQISCITKAFFLKAENDVQILYFVMDYIDGKTLKNYMKSHIINYCDEKTIKQHQIWIRKFLFKSIQIIYQLHEKCNICHQDIKLDNIMINNTNPNDPIFIDFGLSSNIKDINRKYSDIIVGSPIYFPPMLLEASLQKNKLAEYTNPEYLKAKDMYALGLVFYQILNNAKLPIIVQQIQDEYVFFDEDLAYYLGLYNDVDMSLDPPKYCDMFPSVWLYTEKMLAKNWKERITAKKLYTKMLITSTF